MAWRVREGYELIDNRDSKSAISIVPEDDGAGPERDPVAGEVVCDGSAIRAQGCSSSAPGTRSAARAGS